MIKYVRKQSLKMSASMMTGAMIMSPSLAFATGTGGGSDFSTVTSNVTTSIGSIPGLISALSYLFGILLGVLGILKIKDHVENPGNAPLKDGAIRLAAGGALLALPFIYKVMQGSIVETSGNANAVGVGLTKVTDFGQ